MEPSPVAQNPVQPDSAATHDADAILNGATTGTDVQNLPLRPKANGANSNGSPNNPPAGDQHTQVDGSVQAEAEYDDLQDEDYGVASNVPPAEEKKKKKKKNRKPASKRGLVWLQHQTKGYSDRCYRINQLALKTSSQMPH
jgi:hypothetical protein